MSGKLVFALSLFVLSCSLLDVRFNSVGVKSSNGYPVAPDFILTDIDGNEFTLSLYLGKVVLLDFFATWCTASVNQFYHLMNLHEEFGEKLVLISISPENETILKDFREAYSVNWTIAEDISDVFDMYNVSYTPTLVIIDQHGYIRYTHIGLTEESLLRPEIESLLPRTIYVDDDNVAGPWNGTEEHPYQNITSGLEHALDNDTVFVQNGTYYEHVVVDKSISLIGDRSSTTIIDGEGTGSVIYAISDDVTIMGFTVQNSGRLINGTVPDAGISTSHASNLNISGNLLMDNYVSIFVRPSSYAWFTNNVITHSHIGIDINNQSTHNFISGNSLKENNVSIHIYYADSNVFFQNNLTDSPVGVIVRYSCDNAFSENDIRSGLNGMILNGADFNNISKNTMSDLEYGIQLKAYADHNFICENSITNCSYAGIDLDEYVCDNSLSNNTIVSSEVGIDISDWSVNNTIFRNRLTANLVSMHFWYADLNKIFENNITSNYAGVVILYSQSNRFYHNTFLNNTKHVNISRDYTNFWDDGYPSGGNYWSNYSGVDLNHDGIGDSWHEIDENNTDQCPLMGMFSDFAATSECHVQTICNSSICDFQFNGTAISFDVVGENSTSGFCRICIPGALINVTYGVFVNGTEILPPPLPLPCSNSTHSYLYFNYNHSTQEVIIITEFPSAIILSLFMIATLLAVIVYRRKHSA